MAEPNPPQDVHQDLNAAVRAHGLQGLPSPPQVQALGGENQFSIHQNQGYSSKPGHVREGALPCSALGKALLHVLLLSSSRSPISSLPDEKRPYL